MRAIDVFGLFGNPEVSPYPSEQLIKDRSARICAAAEGRVKGDSKAIASSEIYRAITEPAPGSNTPISYFDMTIFLSDAVFNKCPDLKDLIMLLVAEDLNQARKKEEQRKRAAAFNVPPPPVASPSGTSKPKDQPKPPKETTSAPPTYEPVATGYPPTGPQNSTEPPASVASTPPSAPPSYGAVATAPQNSTEPPASVAPTPPSALPPYGAVATGGAAGCLPPNFWDGVHCRGSGGAGASGLVNQAMNLGPSGGAQAITPGSLDVNPAGLSVPSFGGMGRRSFPVVNL
jgi:hypothetical protein